MPLTTPSLATVTAGEPVTAQGWNQLVTGLTALYGAVIALGGGTLEVTVNTQIPAPAGATATVVPLPAADVVAEPLGEGRPVRAIPPFGSRIAHLLVGLTDGPWRIHVQADGFTAEARDVTLPADNPPVVSMTRAGVVVPDLFGTSMQAALSSVIIGLKLNPSAAKNVLLRSTSATGRFTNSMRPGCAGVVILGLQWVARWRTS